MRKLNWFLLGLLVSFALCAPSYGFEIGDFKFKNRLELYHVDTDSGNYDKQLIHDIKVSKKDFPIYLQNRYQVDYDSDLDEKYYFKTTVGFEIFKWMDVRLQRQDYSYKKSDETVYRAGIGLEF